MAGNETVVSRDGRELSLLRDQEISELPDWQAQLADLLRGAWTGEDGISYPPYPDLTHADYWRAQVLPRWEDESMHSWVAADGNRVIAHAAIVGHEDARGRYFEIGRLATDKGAPRGIMTALFLAGTNFIRGKGLYGFLEGTVSHSRSQHMARNGAGWRFGGYVYRGFVAGKHLDGVLLDNSTGEDFVGSKGVVGEVRGVEVPLTDTHRERFQAMVGKVTAARTINISPGGLVHTLPDLLSPLNTIIEQNLD